MDRSSESLLVISLIATIRQLLIITAEQTRRLPIWRWNF